jgi:hypothetical protein
MTVADKHKLDGIAAGATNTAAPEYTSAIGDASDGVTGLMTGTYAGKLDGIATGATNTAAPHYTSAIAVGDGGLTTKNFTTALKTKLDGIATGATNTVGNATHTGDVTGSHALTIASNVVSNSKLADMSASRIKGRITNTGDPQDLTAAQVRTLLNVGDGANNYVLSLKYSALEAGTGLGSGSVIIIRGGAGISTSRSGTAIEIANTYGRPAILSDGSNPSLNSGISAAEIRSLIGAGTGNGTATVNDTGTPAVLSNGSAPYLNSNISAAEMRSIIGAGTSSFSSNQATNTTSIVQFHTVRSSNDIVAYYSDDRLKNRIGNIESALDKVNKLNGFTFTPNEESVKLGLDPEGKVRVGVSAQEVEAVLPEAVTDAPVNIEHGTDYKTVQYEKIVPLLIEAIKELTEQNKELKSEVEILKSINT